MAAGKTASIREKRKKQMGDMADIFRANDEFIKNRRAKRAEEFEPLLIKAGAIQKSGSVYMLDDYLCYPTKGYCAYKKDYRKTRSLREFLKERGFVCGGEVKPPENESKNNIKI